MPGTLELVCRKCTRTESFTGGTITEAVDRAKRRGWVLLSPPTPGKPAAYACPKCPAPRYTTPARRKDSHAL